MIFSNILYLKKKSINDNEDKDRFLNSILILVVGRKTERE